MKIRSLLLTIVSCAIVMLALESAAQSPTKEEIYKSLKKCDSLLFDVAFNQCNLGPLDSLTMEGLIFYHDQGGVTPSKEAFIESIRKNICSLNYRPRRELVKGSLEVYPLKDKGVVYGAIQTGMHRFLALEGDKPPRFTSIARFTHLWKWEGNRWKLFQVYSYDHQTKDIPEKKK